MVNCRDSDWQAEDSLQHRIYCESNSKIDLKNLTFTGYSYDLNKREIVQVLQFDMSKLSIRKMGDHNFKILYDNKLLFVSVKALKKLPETSTLTLLWVVVVG